MAVQLGSREVDVAAAPVGARLAGLRAYETMITAHVTSQRIDANNAVLSTNGAAWRSPRARSRTSWAGRSRRW